MNRNCKLIKILIFTLLVLVLAGCGQSVNNKSSIDFNDLQLTGSDDIKYAEQFKVDRYAEYTVITIGDDAYLVVPEDKDIPYNLPDNMTVLKQPLDKTYLVSTSVMDLICKNGSVSSVRLSGTKEMDWYIDEAKKEMQSGNILYAGKYSAPDYELILSEGCNLAIENTMIYHNPEVKEKLEELGIPVFVEKSSYETHPLGRLEWIKVYGILFNAEEMADNYFDNQTIVISDIINGAENAENKPVVAFFSVTTNGSITVRKPGDYIVKMIELSGGQYALSDWLIEEENALSTMNIQMEDFYAAAKDADILIYNSAIEGELHSKEDILLKNSLFADFKAYKNDRVYCTGKNFFQESTGLAEFMEGLSNLINGNDEAGQYIYKL